MDTGLLNREICGMQSDSGLNRNKMEWVIQAFDDTFGKTVQLLKKPEKAVLQRT